MAGEPFPTMRYHPTEAPVMCATVEEVEALGPAWRAEPYSQEEQAAWHNRQAAVEAERQAQQPPLEITPHGQAQQPPPRSGQPPRRGQAPPPLPPQPEAEHRDEDKDKDQDKDKEP